MLSFIGKRQTDHVYVHQKIVRSAGPGRVMAGHMTVFNGMTSADKV